ncbi:MAG: hypothetical protein SWX82_11100 [Cyanobacteriota bacterium]|nr:hypothetical protein [Cyanobacteriota bacterium]
MTISLSAIEGKISSSSPGASANETTISLSAIEQKEKFHPPSPGA